MLLIIKTGDETGHSVALKLRFLQGVDLEGLLDTAMTVTGQRDPSRAEPWVEVSVRPSFEIVDEDSYVQVEPF